jgi:uncharacterized membrane protein HdeD (DUF308 family)
MNASLLKRSAPVDIHRHWWLYLIRGLLGLGLGIFALAYPGATLGALVIVIGAYVVVTGVIAVAKALSIRSADRHWWVLALEGFWGIAFGCAIFAWPAISVIGLAYLVGYWAILSGGFAIFSAFRLRAHMPGEWLYVLFGIVSVVFGGFVLFSPATGLLYIVLMTSIYGFVTGFTMLAMAFRAGFARTAPAM